MDLIPLFSPQQSDEAVLVLALQLQLEQWYPQEEA